MALRLVERDSPALPVDVVVLICQALGFDLTGFTRRLQPLWSWALGVDTAKHDPQHCGLRAG